jgi:hypothetical protein
MLKCCITHEWGNDGDYIIYFSEVGDEPSSTVHG